MSTRRIEEALDLLGRTRTYDLGMVAELLPAARAEVEAIKKAARFITNIDTDAAITPELAQQADEVSDTLERIAKESKP